MTELIHAFPVANHQRHNVGGRRTGIDAELIKLRSEVIGIRPKRASQLLLACAELERF